MSEASIINRLFDVIEERKASPSPRSYTSKLLAGGLDAIAAKIREEADEVAEAATDMGDQGKSHLVHEAADLIYHVLVMIAYRDLSLRDVETELARRFGTSGLDEKESR